MPLGRPAGGRLGELFAERDALAGQLRVLDERLADAADAAMSLESHVRQLRRSADERSELRHRLELQRAEADAGERRVRDRLEAEWGRPFEQLVEQNLQLAMSVADEVYVLSSGRFVFQGTPAALADETQVLDQHLGVSGTKLM